MARTIHIDPAWHDSQFSEANFDDPTGELIERNKGCDVVDTANWIVRLKEKYPDAAFIIDRAGPGAIIIQILTEKMGIVL